VSSFHLIVVDDEETLRKFLKDMFLREGFEVTVCESGKQALEKLDQNNFDLMLTDIKMPTMDGLELLRRVRVIHPEMPVVMMTGHGTVENAIHALNLGAFNFVRKPFAIDEILKVVHKGLEINRPFRTGRELLPYIHLETVMTIPSQLQLVHGVSFQIVETASIIGGLRSRGKLGLRLAVEELLTNAIIHGNQRDESKSVKVSVEMDQNNVSVTFQDEGDGFDVNSLPDPTNPENLFKGHGRGIFLARFYMDKLEYDNNGSRVSLTKSLKEE
jgi:CheY-like chemotaxis protein